jgi:tetratricopeptide (TPR) repeat protein
VYKRQTQAYSFNEQKTYDKAMVFALKAKEFWPNRWQPYVNLGDALVGMGKPEEAEAAFISSISFNPTWWIVYDDIAAFFVQRNKLDIAEEVFHKGLLKFPENTKLLLHYGQFLLKVNRQEQAMNYLLKAYRLTTDDPVVWTELLKISTATPDPSLADVRKKAAMYVKSKPDEPLSQTMKKILEGH